MSSVVVWVARDELRRVFRDGRFRLATSVLTGLLVTALVFALRDSERMRVERGQARVTNREQWVGQGEKNPHSAAHFGMYAFREPSPLAFFDRGVLSYAGAGVFLEAHEQNLPLYAEAQDGTLARRLGEWTAARVLWLLVPLLIVLLGFGSLAAELERGLLLQVASLGVDLRAYALGKYLGLGAAVLLLLVPGTGLGLLALALTDGVSAADVLPRAAFMALAYLLYWGAFLAMCVGVSALSPGPRRALVLLLGLWAVWALLLPRAAAEVARISQPVARVSEIEQRLAREQGLTADSLEPYEQRVAALQQRVLARHGISRLEDLPINFSGEALLAGEEWGNAAFDRHFGAVHAAYRAQERVVRAAAWLSPALGVSLLSMALAGTDLEHELTFLTAAEQHRRLFVRLLNENVRDHVSKDHAYVAGAALWSQIPDFQAPRSSLGEDLARRAPEAAALVAWLVLSLAALFGAAARLQRRLAR